MNECRYAWTCAVIRIFAIVLLEDHFDKDFYILMSMCEVWNVKLALTQCIPVLNRVEPTVTTTDRETGQSSGHGKMRGQEDDGLK